MPDSLGLDQKLDIYDALLHKWQASINLVSNNTLADSRIRHFEDSLQILPLLPEQNTDGLNLFDLGCGAGFPGLVVAMARPDIKVTLIESDQRKCTFLSTVSRETSTPVTIVNQRIESAETEVIPDIITARALASLDKLFSYVIGWAQENPQLVMLFLKGERALDEIKDAQEYFAFDYEAVPSITSPAACILRITNLSIRSKS